MILTKGKVPFSARFMIKPHPVERRSDPKTGSATQAEFSAKQSEVPALHNLWANIMQIHDYLHFAIFSFYRIVSK